MHPLAAKRQQWRGPAGRQPAQGVIAKLRAIGAEREAKECIGNRNRRYAGAERQPPDREVLRAAFISGSRGGPSKGLLGRVMPPPVAEYGTRVPSLLLTLAERERQEETARAPSRWPAQNSAPSSLRSLKKKAKEASSARGS